MTEDQTDILSTLRRMEQACVATPALLDQVEQVYEAAALQFSADIRFLRQRNQFRVANAGRLSIRRPRILFGRRSLQQLNYQSIPPLRHADVVFLSQTPPEDDRPPVDQVLLDPRIEDFDALLARLPAGFMPDLYFDYQVCATRTLVRGMERAPFPTVATLCHLFMTRKVEQVAALFDYVLPVSPALSAALTRTVAPAKIIDLPFGLSWASFFPLISAPLDGKRDIDVLLSFSSTQPDAMYGSTRFHTQRLFEQARAKWQGRYNFVQAKGLKKMDFLALLGRSRIVLNAVGINGPYNYRTCEAINCGALLMQYQEHFATAPQRMEDFLVPDREYVSFTADTFLEKLGRLLADEPLRAAIAARGFARMERDYSYDALYPRFLAEMADKTPADWQSRRLPPAAATMARLHAHLQSPNTPHMDTSTRHPAIADVGEAIEARPTILLPLFERLECELQRQLYESVVGATYEDCAPTVRNLRFYDTVFAQIAAPSLVDRFNYFALCAQNGRIYAPGLQATLAALDAPEPPPTEDDALEICNDLKIPGVSPQWATDVELAVFNLPCLLSDAPQARARAARDFMRAWLCAILAATQADPEPWRQTAADIMAAYPIERPAP